MSIMKCVQRCSLGGGPAGTIVDNVSCGHRGFRFHCNFSLKSLHVSFNNSISNCTISMIFAKGSFRAIFLIVSNLIGITTDSVDN